MDTWRATQGANNAANRWMAVWFSSHFTVGTNGTGIQGLIFRHRKASTPSEVIAPPRTCPYTFRAIPAIIHVRPGFLPLSLHFSDEPGENEPVSVLRRYKECALADSAKSTVCCYEFQRDEAMHPS